MKIAFFDSGLGGFLMMESVRKKIPEHTYTYVGDTKNVPYGPKDTHEILLYVEPLLLDLVESHDCVVVACNTVCVRALPQFLEKYPKYQDKVINITQLTLERLNPEVNYSLLATIGTVASGAYDQMVPRQYQYPMPGLVDLIEMKDISVSLAMVDDVVKYISIPMTIILGCTHYTWLHSDLLNRYPDIRWVSQDTLLVSYIQNIPESDNYADPKYYVTGNPNE